MKIKSIFNHLVQILLTGICVMITTGIGGCNKALELGPSKTLLTQENVYTSDANAEAVLAGILTGYADVRGMYNGINGVNMLQGLASDELKVLSTSLVPSQFYTNSLSSGNVYYWSEVFTEINQCNGAIEGLTAATLLTPSVKQQLLGEAKFLRALADFYGVNLFQNMPNVTSTNYTINNTIKSSTPDVIFAQIVQDLKDAQALLPDGKYVTANGTATNDRIRPNKQAATALLARAYLYLKDYPNAEAQASAVIGSSIYTLESFSNAFLRTSKESILQFQPVTSAFNDADANLQIITATPNPANTFFLLSPAVLNSFENGDKRLTNWVGTFTVPAAGTVPATTYKFAAKYKVNSTSVATPVTEYVMILRLAEQYLIRAEARAMQNNISGAQSDLNVIRTRAGLPGTTANTVATLQTAILHERQVELFTEGQRWFDLIRTGNIDAVMTPAAIQKGGTWASYKQLIPIPINEIAKNPNLKQNPGY